MNVSPSASSGSPASPPGFGCHGLPTGRAPAEVAAEQRHASRPCIRGRASRAARRSPGELAPIASTSNCSLLFAGISIGSRVQLVPSQCSTPGRPRSPARARPARRRRRPPSSSAAIIGGRLTPNSVSPSPSPSSPLGHRRVSWNAPPGSRTSTTCRAEPPEPTVPSEGAGAVGRHLARERAGRLHGGTLPACRARSPTAARRRSRGSRAPASIPSPACSGAGTERARRSGPIPHASPGASPGEAPNSVTRSPGTSQSVCATSSPAPDDARRRSRTAPPSAAAPAPRRGRERRPRRAAASGRLGVACARRFIGTSPVRRVPRRGDEATSRRC